MMTSFRIDKMHHSSNDMRNVGICCIAEERTALSVSVSSINFIISIIIINALVAVLFLT